jgi:hypothetical protein
VKIFRAGLIEFLIFGAVVVGLTALHSKRLDSAIAFFFLLLLAAASARLVYKSWTTRNDPVESSRVFMGRWASVLPPKVTRWMLGESDTRDPKK